MTHSPAYNEGYRSALAGARGNGNPFQPGTLEMKDWLRGYNDGREALEGFTEADELEEDDDE